MIDFTDPHERSFEELAKRIARMLFDRDDGVIYIPGSDKYQIGCGNDYWLHRREGGGCRLAIRYEIPGRVSALKFMLENHVHVRICEEE